MEDKTLCVCVCFFGGGKSAEFFQRYFCFQWVEMINVAYLIVRWYAFDMWNIFFGQMSPRYAKRLYLPWKKSRFFSKNIWELGSQVTIFLHVWCLLGQNFPKNIYLLGQWYLGQLFQHHCRGLTIKCHSALLSKQTSSVTLAVAPKEVATTCCWLSAARHSFLGTGHPERHAQWSTLLLR